MTDAVAEKPPLIAALVEGYIKLRDKKAEIKARHDAELAPVNEMLDRIEAKLLVQMQQQGVESYKTGAGTAYTQTRTSVSAADWDLYKAFCLEQPDPFLFVDRRVSKAAVDEYVAHHNDLPPGLNYRSEIVVNVRRS